MATYANSRPVLERAVVFRNDDWITPRDPELPARHDVAVAEMAGPGSGTPALGNEMNWLRQGRRPPGNAIVERAGVRALPTGVAARRSKEANAAGLPPPRTLPWNLLNIGIAVGLLRRPAAPVEEASS